MIYRYYHAVLKPYLTEGGNYPMTHIRAIFHKVWWIIRHSPQIPKVLVAADKKSVSIHGTPILLADIPTWYKALLVTAEAQLDKVLCGLKFPAFEELIAKRLNPLHPRDAFIDNHTNRDDGYSFIKDERNGLKAFEGVLLKATFNDSDLNKRFHAYDMDGNPYPRSGTFCIASSIAKHLTIA
jgi:hypothetical protein